MTQVLTSTRDMGREEWLEARRRGIGGSDIPAILGLSKYRSALDVWLEKTGQAQDQPHPPSEAAHFGNKLEAVVADEFAERNPQYRINRRNAILQHADHPWMLANLDREVYAAGEGRGVLEIKTTSAWLRDEWEDDRVPLTAQCQVQWYLAVTGYAYGYVAALIGGQHYAQSRVERDDAVIAELIAAGASFWEHVEDRTMPAVDGSERCGEVLASLYPSAEPDTAIELPPTLAPLLEEYDAVTAERKGLNERLTLIENTLKAELGEAESGRLGGRRVTWKAVTTNRLDAKRVAAEYPEVAAACMVASTYRRFTIGRERGAK